MRVSRPNATIITTPRPSRGLRLAPASPSARGRATGAQSAPVALRSVGGIDALILLQGLEDPTERRRQGVKRGRVALDAPDDLTIGLLGGNLSPSTLNRLKAAASGLKDGSGDGGLDQALGEIELRDCQAHQPLRSPRAGHGGLADEPTHA